MPKYQINVPQAAKLMGKNQMWLRKRIQAGAFQWATYDKMDSGRDVYYIFPKLFILDTGVTQEQLEAVTERDWSDFYTQNFIKTA